MRPRQTAAVLIENGCGRQRRNQEMHRPSCFQRRYKDVTDSSRTQKMCATPRRHRNEGCNCFKTFLEPVLELSSGLCAGTPQQTLRVLFRCGSLLLHRPLRAACSNAAPATHKSATPNCATAAASELGGLCTRCPRHEIAQSCRATCIYTRPPATQPPLATITKSPAS